MTDLTCLDVAADAICTNTGRCFARNAHREQARAALDAIHPALHQLTPDDVRHVFLRAMANPTDCEQCHHIWEVLSRD